MVAEQMVKEIRMTEEFFNRSTDWITEDDAGFAPVEGVMTTAQQIAHVAQTIEWFVEGGSRPEGFDMDFEKHAAAIAPIETVAEAREWYAKAVTQFADYVGGLSDEELYAPLPEGPVMGGVPKIAIIGSVSEHTAHHRGALTVYARLRGKTPKMPYM